MGNTMQITKEMLIEFANANGLRIRDGAWVEAFVNELNRNRGVCAAGKECPCTICTEGLYTRTEYAVPELGEAVNALGEVREKLQSTNGADGETATKLIKECIEIVEKDAGEHDCPKCAEYMKGLGRKLTFLRDECKTDGNSCVVESELTLARVRQMQETFMGTDDAIRGEGDGNNTGDNEEKNEHGTQARKEASSYSEYHDCVQENLRRMNESGKVDRKDMMCIASKTCKRDGVSQEEAIKICTGRR